MQRIVLSVMTTCTCSILHHLLWCLMAAKLSMQLDVMFACQLTDQLKVCGTDLTETLYTHTHTVKHVHMSVCMYLVYVFRKFHFNSLMWLHDNYTHSICTAVHYNSSAIS